MDKFVIFTIAVIILAGFLFWGFQTGFLSGIFSGPAKPAAIPAGVILFYGDGCPHCKNVEDFVLQNKIEEKVKFIRLEVRNNKDNQIVFGKVVQKCAINSSEAGIPLLYDGNGKCYLGDVDTINFFKNASGI